MPSFQTNCTTIKSFSIIVVVSSLTPLYIFFRLRTSLHSYPSHSISIYFTPTHPPLLELSHPRHQTPSLTRPHPPSHRSPFFTPPRISSLAIKTYSFPVVVLIRLPPSRRLFPFPHILPSTSLSPPFDFN